MLIKSNWLMMFSKFFMYILADFVSTCFINYGERAVEISNGSFKNYIIFNLMKVESHNVKMVWSCKG